MSPQTPPPPIACPRCGAARSTATRDGDALWRCGTTTLMLAEGWHVDATDADGRARQIALWRKHLVDNGRRGADVMLAWGTVSR